MSDAVAALHVVAHVEALGRQDVGLLAVGVVQQGDAAGAVGVVLDGGDLGGHAVLGALEVDRRGTHACGRHRGDGTSCDRSTLRPPLLLSGLTSDFSGVVLVISPNVELVWKRRPALVGLRERMAMMVRLSSRTAGSHCPLPG